MPLEVGSGIGDYKVVELLGAGGMGQVYKVQNLLSNRIEALKVLVPDVRAHGDLAERFLREITAGGGRGIRARICAPRNHRSSGGRTRWKRNLFARGPLTLKLIHIKSGELGDGV